MSGTLHIKLNFSGGAELLFDKIKKRDVELPALTKYFTDCQHEKWTIKDLLVWLKENLLRERPELFLQGDSVRPGILVLINDADWELCGELNYEIQQNDEKINLLNLPALRTWDYVEKKRRKKLNIASIFSENINNS